MPDDKARRCLGGRLYQLRPMNLQPQSFRALSETQQFRLRQYKRGTFFLNWQRRAHGQAVDPDCPFGARLQFTFDLERRSKYTSGGRPAKLVRRSAAARSPKASASRVSIGRNSPRVSIPLADDCISVQRVCLNLNLVSWKDYNSAGFL